MIKILNKILLNKKEGETPLETLENFRSKNKLYKNLPMTYAGRLDPMAEGLMIILIGEECKNKEKYLSLDKEYEFQVLFGFATDTYDILGKVTQPYRQGIWGKKELEKEIKKVLKEFLGRKLQKYPIYSSKTVNGQPLFSYARSGENVEIPEREVEIKSLKLIKIQSLKKEKLLTDIEKRINKVEGDFRQKEIIKIWKKSLQGKTVQSSTLHIVSFKIKCSSGTYVRSISNEIGEKLGIPALAYSIKRTKIGKYYL